MGFHTSDIYIKILKNLGDSRYLTSNIKPFSLRDRFLKLSKYSKELSFDFIPSLSLDYSK